MPYLADHVKRQAIEDAVDNLNVYDMNEAELNFTLCTILNKYTGTLGRVRIDSYRRANEAAGAVLLSFLEWHRRAMAPYEDRKATENGDLRWPD